MRRIYDFDGTIFDGDSTARFCLFVLRRHPSLIRYLPGIGWHFLKFALKREEKTEAKQALYRALMGSLRDADGEIDLFWVRNMGRIKKWYLQQKQKDDLVISASPEFLLEPVCRKLGVQLIASRVDKRTGVYEGKNCDGEEKVRRYRAACPPEPFEFYSDAMIDAPMAALSDTAWMVSGDRRMPWPGK